jgi:hypothetical protein
MVDSYGALQRTGDAFISPGVQEKVLPPLPRGKYFIELTFYDLWDVLTTTRLAEIEVGGASADRIKMWLSRSAVIYAILNIFTFYSFFMARGAQPNVLRFSLIR